MDFTCTSFQLHLIALIVTVETVEQVNPTKHTSPKNKLSSFSLTLSALDNIAGRRAAKNKRKKSIYFFLLSLACELNH